MIPFAGHPIVRTAIGTFFALGFTYANIMAVVERRWGDLWILFPLLLLVGFGLFKSAKRLQVWYRNPL